MGGLPMDSFRKRMTRDVGASVSARHPDVTALLFDCVTKHRTELMGNLSHEDGEQV